MGELLIKHIKLLRQLVEFDTTNNPAQAKRPTRACPDFLKAELTQYGLKTEIIEQAGYYSVLGTFGEGRPITLFLAHFDVVPCGPGWKTNPFELIVKGDYGYGRGTADDKGNCTSLLLVAEKLAHQNLPGTIVIAMTGDEEIGGPNGAVPIRHRLEEQNRFPNYLITADGVGMRIITRRRNTCGITITIPKNPRIMKGTQERLDFTTEYHGRASRHSAYFIPGVDRHAVLAASSYLNQHPDLLVAQFDGSFVKSNVVPDQISLHIVDPQKQHQPSDKITIDENLTRLIKALLPISRMHFPAHPSDYGITICPNLLHEIEGFWEVFFDVRAMTTNQEAEEQVLKKILTEKLAGIKFDFKVHMGRAFMNTPEDTRLVRTAKMVAEMLGVKSQPIELGGASDTRHFTDQTIEAIDFGPIGFAVHGSNEHVLLQSIPQTAKFYIQLAEALHQTKSTKEP
jgi:succinyl-diaminopimelate desuccinylase